MPLLETLLVVWSVAPLAGMFLALWYASGLKAAERRSEARAPLRHRTD